MDLKVTMNFIKQYPNFQETMFLMYHDAKDTTKEKLTVDHKRYIDEKTLNFLVRKNQQEHCAVHFAINSIKWYQRCEENVTTINTRVVEMDKMSKEHQMRLIELSPLQPSIVVESKNWYHIYFYSDNWTKEKRKDIMRGLRNFFDWDHKIITYERVMRLPWLDHRKDESDPYEVQRYPMSNKKYTEETMLKAFPDTVNRLEQQKKLKKQRRELEKSDDWFWKKASQINSQVMLELMSWTKWVNWETIAIENNQIYVNGRSTSSWIDENWMIGSHDNWWPTRVQWITWYGNVDWKDLYSWIIDKFPELKTKEEKQTKKEKTKEVVTDDDFFVEYDRDFKIDTKTIVPFTRWSEKLDSYFGRIERGRFMTTLWESWSWKTTWAFSQLIEISRNYKVLFISLEMTAQRVIELRARKMAWITNEEWNDKNIPETKLKYMEERRKEIVENKNLEIVGVNRKAEIIHIDLVLEAIRKKYMHYDWITIDNLWFIKSDDPNMYAELNDIIRKMKNFCHNENKNINLLHHFNKWKWDRRSRTFADALGTWKLENDVDIWVSIVRYLDDWETLTDEEKQQVFIKSLKNRDTGEAKKETLFFKKWMYHDNYQP